MLDWQNKKWIKVIAVIVIASFLSYDVAWATEFSPVSLSTNSINKSSLSSLYQSNRSEEDEEIELSFRSQLIPTKKYQERSGFLRMEAMKNEMKRRKDEIRKHREIEANRVKKNITDYNINKGLYLNAVEKAKEEQSITEQVMKARGATMGLAADAGGFS